MPALNRSGAEAEELDGDAMAKRRLLIITEGHLDIFAAKTAVSLLHYSPEEVVGIVDSQHAGADLASLVDAGAGVPIVESVTAGLALNPDHLVIGVALSGGVLPPSWRAAVLEALRNGMDVINGLHTFLNDDEELVRCATEQGRTLHDLRRVTRDYPVGLARTLTSKATRVLTVGSDCNVGKMAATLSITRDLCSRNRPATMVATGQTGLMVTGIGEVIDAVKSDFLSGCVESLVLEADETGTEFILVEGQGSILHPSFSGVTLGLMHGVFPDLMILCHDASREFLRHTKIPIPPLAKMIDLHERLLEPIHPSKVVAIALNCHGMSPEQIADTIDRTQQDTGLPAADCIRTSVTPLTDTLLEALP